MTTATLRLLAATALLGSGLVLLPSGPAVAGGVGDCTETVESTVRQYSHAASQPLGLLGIKQAQRAAAGADGTPGAGVKVALLDSGVRPGGQVSIAASYSTHLNSVHTDAYHGTAVAGLIAGRTRPGDKLTGIAPGAQLVDIQTYGWPEGNSDSGAQPSSEALAAGLAWLAPRAKSLGVRVAVVPQAVTPIPAVATAVRQVQDAGVLVVAAPGNRPTEDTPGYLSEYATTKALPPGSDGFSEIAPALYPGVLTAGTTAAGHTIAFNSGSIPNHAVDVVVPTSRAISIALNGGNCVLTSAETSWSAAEVGGIAALLFQRYPRATPAQIAARIVDTASGTLPDRGSGSSASLYFGAGVVQPLEALTRPLSPGGRGFRTLEPQRHRTPPAKAPLPQGDVLHRSREVAVWGGLLGGAVVIVAAMLRPVFNRRTRRSA